MRAAAPFSSAELEMRPVTSSDLPPQRALPVPNLNPRPQTDAVGGDSATTFMPTDWQPVADEQGQVY
jgi:hypothetical protein